MRNVSGKEQEALVNGICPICGATLFLSGPRGGAARNILCIYCRAEFNYSIVASELLTDHCAPERQKQLYDVDEAELPRYSFPKSGQAADANTLENVIEAGCMVPDCDHNHPKLVEICLGQSCHPGEGIRALYRKGTAQLWLDCVVCHKPIHTINVHNPELLRHKIGNPIFALETNLSWLKAAVAPDAKATIADMEKSIEQIKNILHEL